MAPQYDIVLQAVTSPVSDTMNLMDVIKVKGKSNLCLEFQTIHDTDFSFLFTDPVAYLTF